MVETRREIIGGGWFCGFPDVDFETSAALA